jgi:nucleoside-diphosphate-sugar epimerase
MSKVTLLGADGKLGPTVLEALLAGGFQVTVLKRSSSTTKSSYPASVQEVRVADAFEVEELTTVLTGQDAVVVTIPGSKTDIQKRLAEAAVKAGVQHFIPADFGSCDSQSARACELVPLYTEKTKMRNYLEVLATANHGFSWTSLVCGHFFDWDIHFLHLNAKERKADVLDDGEVPWSATTLGQIGRAVVGILQNTSNEKIRNKMLYIQSFRVTQNQVIKAFEKATGQTWKIQRLDSAKYTAEKKKEMEEGDAEATEDVVWVLGTLEADWQEKETFANELLGLQQEDLDEVVKRLVN